MVPLWFKSHKGHLITRHMYQVHAYSGLSLPRRRPGGQCWSTVVMKRMRMMMVVIMGLESLPQRKAVEEAVRPSVRD